MNLIISGKLCRNNNSEKCKKLPVSLCLLLAVMLSLGVIVLVGGCSKSPATSTPEQASTNSGDSAGESKAATSTGDADAQNNGGSSSPSTGGTDNNNSTTGDNNSSSGDKSSGENKTETTGQNTKTPAAKEPFVSKKYADAAKSINAGSEISLEIIAYYNGLYGVGKCTIDAEYNEGVSWVYIVTTPDGTVKYILPLNTCVLYKAS